MKSKRYVSEGLKEHTRALLVIPRTVMDLENLLGCSHMQVRFCLRAVGAVFKGRQRRGTGAGRPFDLWGLP